MSPQAPRHLINHRRVAELFGVSVRCWRHWIDAGTVPAPHQQIGTMMLYDIEVINHRLATGKWPSGVAFRGKAVRASRKSPSADPTPNMIE